MARSVSRPTSPPDFTALFEGAREAATNAYAPYSRLLVGAAIRTVDGRIHLGCNVENVAYPLGICAEAAALAAARVATGPSMTVSAIAIYARRADGTQVSCTPCGGCRQRILEFGPEIPVGFYNQSLHTEIIQSKDLLLHGFTF